MAESPVLLITGGSRGIGAATARLAASRGYAVAVNYREQEKAAQAVVDEIIAAGGKAIAIQADVGVEADVQRMFAEVDERLGPLRALVNNAGINGNKSPVSQFCGDVLQRLFAVNVLGVMLCCREAVRRMATGFGGSGGAIVNVSSMAATIGGRATASDYAASKAAMDAFTVGLAKEVGPQGIRVNVIRPGMTLTDMSASLRDNPVAMAEASAIIGMNRVANAEEMALPILWLLSDEASFISGARLDASGGGFIIGKRGEF